MPVVHVDTEQAALIEVALVMLEAALTARTARVDPEEVISKALQLQAYKLATVRKLLALPDPPPFSQLDPALMKKVHHLLDPGWEFQGGKSLDERWEALRAIINAAPFPHA